jgi:alpha-amylase/alpha-mannosidase (GH57 family)
MTQDKRSMAGKGLDLMLCWHMHQPEYRDLTTGEFALPWVYLHAIKDYTDMAAHAERHPGVRMVFNLVPVLLEQLDDYAQQFASAQWRDPLLRWLVCADFSALAPGERRQILLTCFRVNHETMLQPFAGYRRVHAWAEQLRDADDADLAYLSEQYFADAVMWYHLSWTGETLRRAHPELLAFMQRGGGFTLAQRRSLSALLGGAVGDVIARYRRLAERGQIELSTTPYFHPITPLLLDFASARESLPDAPLPQRSEYPGGRARAEHHLQQALSAHARWFGAAPHGVWPAEGGVSSAGAQSFAAAGVRWMATGEGVLANSLRRAQQLARAREDYLYTPYAVGACA